MTDATRSYRQPVGRTRRARIGLLGGSFNPAHAGHARIAREALKRLRLDRIWWLVAPQNPLKPVAGMAPFAERIAGAQILARGARSGASDLEARLGTRFTADTLAKLRARHRGTRFVWLMGADSFADLAAWRFWPQIFQRVVIAVFARAPYDSRALAGKAARRFRHARIAPGKARVLARLDPPAWVFLPLRHHPASASAIRAAARRPKAEEVEAILKPSPRPRTPRKPAAKETLVSVAELMLLEDLAEDVKTISLAGKADYAEHLILASAASARRLVSMAEHLVTRFKAAGLMPRVEGLTHGNWVLIDAGALVVHLFRPETRAYYDLEKLWEADLPHTEQAAAAGA